MFFEPAPAGESVPSPLPESPPWSMPPVAEAGVLLAASRLVARSALVAVFLPAIRVFSTGCMLEVEIVSRQAALPEDDWWDLRMAVFRGARGFRGASLPDRLLRLGVRYADGQKATTLDPPHRERRDSPPAGPLLSWRPASSGTRRGGEGFINFGLWLWPLPPPATFEFAVEWPLGGIEFTIAELDGRPIVEAASQPSYYWPPAQPDTN
jgi:hypothetical protein